MRRRSDTLHFSVQRSMFDVRCFPLFKMSRILIIEDEAPMRTALADLLTAEGYRVLSAADGESGLQRALDEKPDLILLDVMMPKLDGFALCAELRRLANTVPVLMLTPRARSRTGLPAWTPARMIIRQTLQHRGTACPGAGAAARFSGSQSDGKIAAGRNRN